MRKYSPSASFMCKALYKKGYIFLFSEQDVRYFLSYFSFWNNVAFVKRAADTDVFLVILPNRKPNLMRKYIDKDYATSHLERTMSLSESCKDCLCSHCRMLDHCNIVDNRTDQYCHNNCQGRGEAKSSC